MIGVSTVQSQSNFATKQKMELDTALKHKVRDTLDSVVVELRTDYSYIHGDINEDEEYLLLSLNDDRLQEFMDDAYSPRNEYEGFAKIFIQPREKCY